MVILLQNCNSRFLLLLELFYVLESAFFKSLRCLLDIRVIVRPVWEEEENTLNTEAKMYFHQFDNAVAFFLGSVSGPDISSGFHNLKHLPLDQLLRSSRSRSGPRSRHHPKATQQCQRRTDQENSGEAACQVRLALFQRQALFDVNEVKIRCSWELYESAFRSCTEVSIIDSFVWTERVRVLSSAGYGYH